VDRGVVARTGRALRQAAALRHLFDWLVTGQVMPINPAHTVRGPRHVVTSGQTPALDPSEARAARQHRCLYALRLVTPDEAAAEWQAAHGGRRIAAGSIVTPQAG